jgi:small-conductance mechanosensitive channel
MEQLEILLATHRREAIFSAILLVGVIGRGTRDPDLRQRLRRAVTYMGTSIVLAGLVALWFQQIQQAVLALTALAVAFVVASKELILCGMGGLYKAFVDPYEIGDRIEVAGVRGDVVDAGLLATTLLEIGPDAVSQRSTGRFIYLPHSVLLAPPLHNATTSPFAWHEITLHLGPSAPWRDIDAALIHLAREEHAPIQVELERSVEELKGRFSYRPPPSTPAVFASLDADGHVRLTLRYAVRSRQRRVSEDRVVRALVERFGPAVLCRSSAPPGGLKGDCLSHADAPASSPR